MLYSYNEEGENFHILRKRRKQFKNKTEMSLFGFYNLKLLFYTSQLLFSKGT